MVKLAELQVFIAAAEETSFSKAAARLRLSQPAVSQSIQALERRLGVQLFQRAGRRVRLTEAGQALLPLARDLVARADRLQGAAAALQGKVMGELRLGCATNAGLYILAHLAAAFQRQHPAVRLQMEMQPHPALLERLLDQRLAIGVASHTIEHPDLEHRPWFEDHLTLIAPAGHPWAMAGPADPAELADQPLILRESGASSTQTLLRALAAHGIQPAMLNVVLQLGSDEAVVVAVEQGVGVGFVSAPAALRGARAMGCRPVHLPGLQLARWIYLVRNRRAPLTRAQSAFWNFVLQERRDQPAGILRDLARLPGPH